jgi:DNA topoisomerase IA
VASVDRRQVRRNPPPPFITSTLQQEASRKLGLGAATAMRIAQRLYEGVDIGGETSDSLLICAPTACSSPPRRSARPAA